MMMYMVSVVQSQCMNNKTCEIERRLRWCQSDVVHLTLFLLQQCYAGKHDILFIYTRCDTSFNISTIFSIYPCNVS